MMVMQGETVATGAELEECEFCGDVPALGTYRSAAGWYIGYWCCMPFSRESCYYPDQETAELMLDAGGWGR